MKKLSNIPLSEIRRFLIKIGCKQIEAKGDHEKWTRSDLERPIILQQTKDPPPEFVVRNMLRDLGMTRSEFINVFLEP